MPAPPMGPDSRYRDESELRWLIERYFAAMDAKDSRLLRSCYARDCTVVYHRGEARELRLEGRDAVVGHLTGTAAWTIATIHALSSAHVHRDPQGQYRALVFAVAQLPTEGQVLVRGLRYDDTFSRDEEGWVIRTRDHKALWQYNAMQAPSTVAVHKPAQG